MSSPEPAAAVGGSAAAATPFLKWAGGKSALLPRILPRFPAEFAVFYEPFFGGGAVGLALAPSRGVAADGNGWLIGTYQAVRAGWRAVARILDGMVNSREEFLRIRSVPPESLSPAGRAAQLIYLNKTCFRGLFRVNQEGRFNVPWGDYDRRFYDPKVLRAAAAALRGVELRHGDFEEGLRGIGPQDFAYLDPPYWKLGGNSDFDRYTSGKFRRVDHERLADCCRDLDRRGIRFALSNSDTDLIRTLYAGFRFTTFEARREINLRSSQRNITELFITNYD